MKNDRLLDVQVKKQTMWATRKRIKLATIHLRVIDPYEEEGKGMEKEQGEHKEQRRRSDQIIHQKRILFYLSPGFY